MNVWRGLGTLSDFMREPRQIARVNSFLVYFLLLFGSLFASYFIQSRTGTRLFMMAIIGIFIGIVYIIISFTNLRIPFILFILTVGGFKYLLWIRTPMLPDLSLDRIALIGLALTFFVKYFAQKRAFRGPYTLDLLLLAAMLYILTDIFIHGMFPFNSWTMSYLIPISAYFFAKNLITTKSQIRVLFMVFMGLAVYYNITSIAEKFHLNALIFPRYILEGGEFYGRSNGPFAHAPIFGTVIGMLIPVNMYFIATVKKRLLKLALFGCLLSGFAGLLFTYTRGSWLAGLMALIVVVSLNPKQYLKILLPTLVLAPLLAISVLQVGEDKFMKERVASDNTVGSRLGTWVTAFKVWRANPVFGVGWYNYRKELDNYIEPLELPIMGTIPVFLFRHNPPHDIYISYLAETGLVGVILQGSIYLVILRAFLIKYKWRRRGSYFATYFLPVFGGIFVGYLVGGIAIDYKYFSVVGTMFYACAGIMYGYQPEKSEASEAFEASDIVLQANPGDDNLDTPKLGVLRQPTSQVD